MGSKFREQEKTRETDKAPSLTHMQNLSLFDLQLSLLFVLFYYYYFFLSASRFQVNFPFSLFYIRAAASEYSKYLFFWIYNLL